MRHQFIFHSFIKSSDYQCQFTATVTITAIAIATITVVVATTRTEVTAETIKTVIVASVLMIKH